MPGALNVPRTDGLTHAGGVVTCVRDGEPLFLLVRASRPPHDWVLPKGHIEAGEAPEETAEREVLEETGVEAEVVAVLGDVSFEDRTREVRVRFFLMRARAMTAALEDREICWCSPAEAERLLVFENAREMVRRASEVRSLKGEV
jgi:8-oxo-dGTP pyrophosphatase MutT (NUDIX family)